MNTATAAKLDAITTALVTCPACGVTTRHIGSKRERNGMFCTCLTTGASTLARWIGYPGPKTHTKVSARTLRTRITDSKCGGECRSAKSELCACSCGGENHGSALGLRF